MFTKTTKWNHVLFDENVKYRYSVQENLENKIKSHLKIRREHATFKI